MPYLTMQELMGSLANQRVLIRADLNVPLKKNVPGALEISDDTRIKASVPTIQAALDAGAGVIVMSHLGRPQEGRLTDEDRIEPIAARLGQFLEKKVTVLNDNWQHYRVSPHELVMLQNVRCNVGEKQNSDALGQHYAALCDVFINDAFGTAHRAEASTYAVAKFAPKACAGLLMAAELDALGKALAHPARPLLAIVAGSKVSTKLTILETLAQKVDQLVVGGGIANTFLLAEGAKIGKSLAEPTLIGQAKAIIDQLRARGGEVPLPSDVVVGKRFDMAEKAETKPLSAVQPDDMIFDIGPQSAKQLADLLKQAGTIVWNGPVGVFEFDQFGHGTETIAHAIAQSKAFSIAGGGDTLAAIDKYKVKDKMSYCSTGGGAFLEFLEGKKLPALAILEQRAQHPS